MRPAEFGSLVLFGALAFFPLGLIAETKQGKAEEAVVRALANGVTQDVMVVFRYEPVHNQMKIMRLTHVSGERIEETEKTAYAASKERALAQVSGAEVLRNYEHLPVMYLRLHSASALAALTESPD